MYYYRPSQRLNWKIIQTFVDHLKFILLHYCKRSITPAHYKVVRSRVMYCYTVWGQSHFQKKKALLPQGANVHGNEAMLGFFNIIIFPQTFNQNVGQNQSQQAIYLIHPVQ